MMSGQLPYWGASVLLWAERFEPILFLPAVEPRDHIPDGLRVYEYPWGSLECSDPFSVLIEAILLELRTARVELSRVGMLRNASRTSPSIQAAEQTPIPDAFQRQLSAMTAAPDAAMQEGFLRLYLTKSPEEIAAIRMANQVAAVGIQAFHEAARLGLTEAEVAATAEWAISRQIGTGNIFYARGWAAVQSGPNSADGGRYNRSTGRKLENGDLILLELATCVNGYWSDLTRMAVVGTAKPELQRILSVVREAQELAVAAVRPGIRAGEIDAIARDTIARHGFSAYFNHGTGHHVGFRYHDPGFGIVPGETERLKHGMIITVEPGVYVSEFGGGARIEDNVLVTESGSEVLSRESTLPGRKRDASCDQY